MSETETPVSGGGAAKGAPDGVSEAPVRDKAGPGVSGRTPGGESGGGGYPSPQTGKGSSESGFLGHGGQAEIGYHGGGQAGEQGGDAPNAATGSDSSDGRERGAAAWTAPEHHPRTVQGDGRSFTVVETSGVAEAEAQGKVGTDASYEREQESPGSG